MGRSDEAPSTGGLLTALTSAPTVASAARIALVVGTVLNAVNHGAMVLDGHWSDIAAWRVLMNYVVPYCVASYSAARNELRNRR